MKKFQIGQQVVQTGTDYLIGRIGTVVIVDEEKERASVKWHNASPNADKYLYTQNSSYVSFEFLELTSIPYEIIEEVGKWKKYQPLAIA